MVRKLKDSVWSPSETPGWDSVACVLLQDIRDELKEMNRRLRPLHRLDCPEFVSIPAALRKIRIAVERKRKRKAVRK